MNPKYISIFLCCFIFGVGLGSLVVVPTSVLLTVVVCCLVGFVLLLFWKVDVGLVILSIFFGIGFGYWYVDVSFSGNEFEDAIGTEINLEGIVAQDPVNGIGANGRGQQLTLLPDGYTQNLRAQLYTAIPDVSKGDRVWIRGEVQLPENVSEFEKE